MNCLSTHLAILSLAFNLFSGTIKHSIADSSVLVAKAICHSASIICDLERSYDSLVNSQIKNILFYKELNTPSGNKAILIWRDKHCIYGITLKENLITGCKQEEVNPENDNLWLIASELFSNETANYSITRSKIEAMHDYKIIIQAVVNGRQQRKEFFDSDVGNNPEFLAKISRLCQNILYPSPLN